MKIKSTWYIILLLIIFIVVNKYFENKKTKKFEEEILLLENERDSLVIEKLFYINEKNSLDEKVKKSKQKVENLTKKLDSITKLKNEIPDNVSNMDERELDSILTGYRHPNRN